jgi:hypothetical protein
MCMYTRIDKCMCIHVCIYIHIYLQTHIYTNIQIHIFTFTYDYKCVHVSEFVDRIKMYILTTLLNFASPRANLTTTTAGENIPKIALLPVTICKLLDCILLLERGL